MRRSSPGPRSTTHTPAVLGWQQWRRIETEYGLGLITEELERAADEDLLDALVRDHLSDHRDSILAAWIAAKHARPGQPAPLSHRH